MQTKIYRLLDSAIPGAAIGPFQSVRRHSVRTSNQPRSHCADTLLMAATITQCRLNYLAAASPLLVAGVLREGDCVEVGVLFAR
jgi:hypothetical protein